MLRSLILGLTATCALGGAAQAADMFAPATPQPIYEAAGFDWEGAYAGVQVGGSFDENRANGVIGGLAGYNFIVADPILVGVDFQATYDWNENFHSTKFTANARIGAIVTDSVMVYALGGVGRYSTTFPHNGAIYQFGAGVELAVTDSVTVRGEVLGIRAFEDDTVDGDAWTRATVGVAYHF